MGLVALEQGVHDARALGVGEELVAVADEPAGRNREFQTDAARAVVHAVDHAALALRDLVGHDAHEVFVAIDVKLLDGSRAARSRPA